MATRSTNLLSTVLDPRGQPTNIVEPHPLAPRLDTLEGKTVYLIDVGFGGGWSSSKRRSPGSRAPCRM